MVVGGGGADGGRGGGAGLDAGWGGVEASLMAMCGFSACMHASVQAKASGSKDGATGLLRDASDR
eukprot:51876-Eustigmatos_ZCMA.PRE.1